ncbi:Putative phospholipase B-like 2, partial [Tauraco erythrolophus]
PFKYESEYCEKLRSYLEANLGWMEEQMGKGKDPEYWHQVRTGDTQFCCQSPSPTFSGRSFSAAGAGWSQGRFSSSPAPWATWWVPVPGPLQPPASVSPLPRSPFPPHSDCHGASGTGTCTGMGWRNPPAQMDKQSSELGFATLTLPSPLRLPRSQIPGSIQVFSSYPGTIFSGDDFYILSSGLVALETTIGNNNPARWKYLDPRSSVLEWLRTNKAGCWRDAFRLLRARYNNQWMVVDYNAFVPGRASPPQGLLTVLEQIPYFEEIFNASGNPELVKKYGDWFTYDKNPRAQIFRRNQTLVHDLDSMVRLMRSNNYLRDPLSRCRGCDPPQNAENAISARSDLNPPNGTYPFPALRQRCHGGTDMKVGEMGKPWGAAGGPLFGGAPPGLRCPIPVTLLHMGHPDLWTFPPVKVHWD